MSTKLSEIARQVVSDIKSEKEEAIYRFLPTLYIGIASNNEIEGSSYPYLLDTVPIAIIVISYSYQVITQDDQSAYIVFIDEKRIPSDRITKGEWTVRFNSPYTNFYRTYVREAIISNDEVKLVLPVNPRIGVKEIEGVWNIFQKVRGNMTLEELALLGELYTAGGYCPSAYHTMVSSLS